MILATFVAVFSAYILTVVVTGSSLLAPIRGWLLIHTPRLRITPDYPHFVECRLCVGFWVSGAICLASGLPWPMVGLIYGASYFLATQER
jgi:hypothetical protein